MDYSLAVPCLLGLEGPIADELRRLDLKDVAAENGRVNFRGGAEAVARANINLRIGERVLLELGRFQALSFDELAAATGFSAARLNSHLTMLELRGIIEKVPGGLYRSYC